MNSIEKSKQRLDDARNRIAFHAVLIAEGMKPSKILKQLAIEFLDTAADFTNAGIYSARAAKLKQK